MSEAKANGNFGKLIDELEVMSKALDADDDLDPEKKKDGEGDEKIEAAAAAGDLDDGAGAGDDEEEELGKALTVTLDDGTVLEAVDGTELVKALMAKMDTSEGLVTKSLGLMLNNLQKVADTVNNQAAKINEQADLIKSLSETIDVISAKPGGRKVVLSVHEKQTADDLKKSLGEGADGISTQEFMAKALAAQKVGKITGMEVSKAESCINSNIQVPEEIIRKVIG